jgi:hypothetical protein
MQNDENLNCENPTIKKILTVEPVSNPYKLDWTDQWDDCGICEFCNSMVHQSTINQTGWLPIETMPTDLWCYVFVPGAGMGLEAMKNSDGIIFSLQSRRLIFQATHWRKSWSPPSGDLSGNYDFVSTI